MKRSRSLRAEHRFRYSLFRFFPAAKQVAETFPSVETTREPFAAAGFTIESLESIPQVSAPSLRGVLERVRLRADATLAALSDAEFAAGLDTVERTAREERAPAPVIDYLDLLVLRSASF